VGHPERPQGFEGCLSLKDSTKNPEAICEGQSNDTKLGKSGLDRSGMCIYNVITLKSLKEIYMGSCTKTHIIKIGNSRGIRIPKILLDQAKLGDEIELEVQGEKLIVRSVRSPRQGWDEQFAEMARRGDDKLP
jgi:antitoxin MazE